VSFRVFRNNVSNARGKRPSDNLGSCPRTRSRRTLRKSLEIVITLRLHDRSLRRSRRCSSSSPSSSFGESSPMIGKSAVMIVYMCAFIVPLATPSIHHLRHDSRQYPNIRYFKTSQVAWHARTHTSPSSGISRQRELPYPVMPSRSDSMKPDEWIGPNIHPLDRPSPLGKAPPGLAGKGESPSVYSPISPVGRSQERSIAWSASHLLVTLCINGSNSWLCCRLFISDPSPASTSTLFSNTSFPSSGPARHHALFNSFLSVLTTTTFIQPSP
jgi:hypothetical protein